MNEEIPYEPPGMDAYLQSKAESNARWLRKRGLLPERPQTESAQADSVQRVVQCATCNWFHKHEEEVKEGIAKWGMCSRLSRPVLPESLNCEGELYTEAEALNAKSSHAGLKAHD